MTDVNSLSALHEYTSAFIAAMPPVLPSQTMTPSSLFKTVRMVSSSTDAVGSYLPANRDSAVRGSWSVVKPRADHCGGVCWGREVEAAVLRREMSLRRQLDRQRHAEEQRRRQENAELLARHAEEQRRRDCEWDGRLQKVLREHMKETLGLREEIEREQELVARSEAQLTETRTQLTQLHTQLEEMLRQKRESEALAREADTASLTEMHQKSLERLQRVFEEDKLQAKQWFTEELQRVQSNYERLRTDAEDSHRQQLRRMEADMTELQRRLRDSEAEVQQYKAKAAAAAAVKPALTSADEARTREEIRTLRTQLSDALDAKLRADRRATEAERETNERFKALEVLQMEFDAVVARHDKEQRSLREANQDLTDELTRTRTAHAEEIENLRKNVRTNESVTSRETAKEFEATFRRMNERYDDMRRTLEEEKTQLMRRLKEVEQQYDDAKRRLQLQIEQVEEMRSEGIRQQHQNTEKDRLITELRLSIEELKRTGGAVADLTARNRELQQEIEQRRRQHESAVQAMDNNVQELRRERDAAQGKVAALVEELSTAQRSYSEKETRSKQLLDEAELRERQLRREAEEAKQNIESLKEHCSQLQATAAAAAVSAPKTQNLLYEKDNELARLRNTIDAVKHDRDVLEQRLREESVVITKKEQELYERQVISERLNMEVISLREQLQMATKYAQSVGNRPSMQEAQHSLLVTKPTGGLPSDEQHAPRDTITNTPAAPVQPSTGSAPAVPVPMPTQMRSSTPSVPSVSPTAAVQPSTGSVPAVPVPMPTQMRSSTPSVPSVSPAAPVQPSTSSAPAVPVPMPTQMRSSTPSVPSVSPAAPVQPSTSSAPAVPVPVPVQVSQPLSFTTFESVPISTMTGTALTPQATVVSTVNATSVLGGISSIPTPVPVSVCDYKNEDSRPQVQMWGSVPMPVPVAAPVPVASTTSGTHAKEKKKREHKEHKHREHKHK